jgi:hypothetical protein
MTSFNRQRWFGTLFFVVASALAVVVHRRGRASIGNWTFLNGWVLLGVMLLLASYNARKKLPFLPVASSEGWLQFHIYAGLFTGTLFILHLDFRWPASWFGQLFAGIYALVMVSGIFGLVLSRVFPKRLVARGGEVFYEQIPALRHKLATEAEALALASIPAGAATTLAELFERRLRAFLAGPRNFWPHLLESRRPLNALLDDLHDLRRYLNEPERATLDQMEKIVRQKDGLDYHFALQTTLKLWLFVHLPLTYSVLICTAAHLAIVFAFSGGAQ